MQLLAPPPLPSSPAYLRVSGERGAKWDRRPRTRSSVPRDEGVGQPSRREPRASARGELALIHAPVASPGEGGNAGVVDGDGGRAPTLPQARPSPSPGRRIPRRMGQRARPHLPHRGRHQISSTIARSPDARRPTICTVCTWRLALSRAERTLTPLRRVAEANARLQITITMTAPPSITRAVQL